MAKILTTAIVADIRNKLNGSVFSKNRYGGYVRTKVTPVNPQTPAQQAARNRLSSNSSAWRSLTQAQRQAWIDAAVSFPFTDIFGNTKILSGNALFVKLNNNLLAIGAPTISAPPTPVAVPDFAINSVDFSAGGPSVEAIVSIATMPAGFKMLARTTPQIPASQLFVKNKLRNLSVISTLTAGSVDLTTAFTSKFGSLVVGNRISIELYLINSTTGQAGIPVNYTSVITA